MPVSAHQAVLVFAQYACRRVPLAFQRFPPELAVHRWEPAPT